MHALARPAPWAVAVKGRVSWARSQSLRLRPRTLSAPACRNSRRARPSQSDRGEPRILSMKLSPDNGVESRVPGVYSAWSRTITSGSTPEAGQGETGRHLEWGWKVGCPAPARGPDPCSPFGCLVAWLRPCPRAGNQRNLAQPGATLRNQRNLAQPAQPWRNLAQPGNEPAAFGCLVALIAQTGATKQPGAAESLPGCEWLRLVARPRVGAQPGNQEGCTDPVPLAGARQPPFHPHFQLPTPGAVFYRNSLDSSLTSQNTSCRCTTARVAASRQASFPPPMTLPQSPA